MIGDGALAFDAALFNMGGAAVDVAQLLAAHNLPTASVPATINTVLVDTGDKLVLLDTGIGDFRGFNTDGGHLLETLKLLTIQPDAIDAVMLSHIHPDHLAGASIDGKPLFPNADYYLPELEWDFLANAPVPADGQNAMMLNLAKAKLAPIQEADQLTLYGDGEEIVPGIQAVAALGHTPGHHGALIHSGDSQLFYLADAFVNSLIHVTHPEWRFGVDTLPDVSVATRQHLLTQLADEQRQVLAAHFPFPGIGYISRGGDSFHYTSYD